MSITPEKFDYSKLLAGEVPASRIPVRVLIVGLLLCAAALVTMSAVHAPGIQRYQFMVQKSVSPAGVEQELVLAMISVESNGRTRAISKKGAVGLMQIMPRTARQMALEIGMPSPSVDDLFDPDTNIRLGVAYISKLMKRYDGDMILALGAYNAGPGTIHGWRSANSELTSRELCLTVFYPETRGYIISVLKKRKSLISGT